MSTIWIHQIHIIILAVDRVVANAVVPPIFCQAP